MFKHALFVAFFLAIIIVAVLNALALTYAWYWLYWWMDVVAHTLGGFAVGLGTLWIVFFSGMTDISFAKIRGLLFVLVSVLCIGFAWEVFELYTNVFIETLFYFDALYDTGANIAGALTAYVLVLGYHRVSFGKSGGQD